MIKINDRLVEFETFPNGETLLVQESLKNSLHEGKENAVHFKYESDADLIKLMFVKNHIDSLTGLFNMKIALYIYYMPYSRMDRSENLSPFTLKHVAKLINDLKFDQVFVIEPHSDVTPAVLDRAESVFVNFDLIEKVKEEVGFDMEEDYIMFPDAGASKRYGKMNAKNVAIGHKKRNFQTGQIEGFDVVFNSHEPTDGKKVIIVDDMTSYGGTFVHSEIALRKLYGFKEVYLLVAHAENSVLHGNPKTGVNLFDHIDKLFTTDSILTEHNNWEFKKFAPKLKIYSLEDYVNGRL
ncbi:phosphoribosylpyrophosphate synthetase [Bacillus phage Kirov]|uniref:ribose-phosphate diphosphokinase n=1 Tax=Bacillus phage Kirov TaxID=2783539 RepID=A0A7U3NJT6_9CAUD|nr:ribose-phosphate pyrophosphokinase [Bacillus phage Kirov]QOV08289.1 phosphoribosylpyrophosphate synthetase [Bacillus phage Kirov]